MENYIHLRLRAFLLPRSPRQALGRDKKFSEVSPRHNSWVFLQVHVLKCLAKLGAA